MKQLAIALLALSLFGADKPNLSGDWDLDVAASDFAKETPPKGRLTKILHHEPDLEIRIGDGVAKYTTDGKEATNDVYGNAMKAVTKWEGDVLVMETNGSFGTNKIKLIDRYELSKDKKTLTLRRHFEGQRGGVQDQVLIMCRK